MSSNPTAVIVGLCAHGLTIARALHKSGIPVVALEADLSLPGAATKSAQVIRAEDINGSGLIDALVSLAPTVSQQGMPVLFLTNDRMVSTVGSHFGRLRGLYRLSWGECSSRLTPLLKKENIGARCLEAGLAYPRSRLIARHSDLIESEFGLRFPVIFKPDQPVSAYKTVVAESVRAIDEVWKTIRQSLPSVAQEYILGNDDCIYFSAMHLDRGNVVARYEGRKLRSRPMGHTTVAISESNEETHDLAKRFFAGLELSGPVSLELKKDPASAFWVIEPTVGRTDFWVGLCIRDGVNLPHIEYCIALKRTADVQPQRNRTLWINGERDPAALLWLLFHHPVYCLSTRIVGVWIDHHDWEPWIKWAATYVRRLPSRAVNASRRVMKLILKRG